MSMTTTDVHRGRPVDPVHRERGEALMAAWALGGFVRNPASPRFRARDCRFCGTHLPACDDPNPTHRCDWGDL